MDEKKKRLSDLSEAVASIAGDAPEISGGGRGWTATVGEITVKASSKEEALTQLLAQAKAAGLEQGDMSDGEFARCVVECVDSIRPYCECKCQGANHGVGAAGLVMTTGRTATPLRPKACLCGCGGVTFRRFMPGHDAAYHAKQKMEAAAAAAGLTVEQYTDARNRAKKSIINERTRAKRAAKKAAALAAVVEEVAAAVEA